MVDYYYGAWQPGRVHESRLYPDCSVKGGQPFSLPGVDRFGNQVSTSYGGVDHVPDTESGYVYNPLLGVESISGGALPLLFWSTNYGAASLYNPGVKDQETRDGPFPFVGTPGDPGWYTVEPSATAQQNAATGMGDGSYFRMPEAGIGYMQYGKRWPWYDGGLFSSGGHHEEHWLIRSRIFTLVSDLNFENPMENAESGVGLPFWGQVGVAPPKEEWPEGVTHIEIAPPSHGLNPFQYPVDREYLEIRFEGTQSNIPVIGAFQQVGNRNAWADYNTLPTPAAIAGGPKLTSGMTFPADAMTAWRNFGMRDGGSWGSQEAYDDWRFRVLTTGWTPELPAPMITPWEYRGRPYFGDADPPIPPEGDNVVQTGWTGTANYQGDFSPELYPGEKPWLSHISPASLDFSVYVKFRTPEWRFVYDVEPSISGKPDIVRRRFT